MDDNRMPFQTEAPPEVVVISVLMFLGTLLLLLLGLLAFLMPGIFTTQISFDGEGSILFGADVLMSRIIGALLLIGAALYAAVSRGLWKLKSWARMTAIALYIVTISSFVFSMIINPGVRFIPVVLVITNVILLYFLTLKKNVVEAFRSHT